MRRYYKKFVEKAHGFNRGMNYSVLAFDPFKNNREDAGDVDWQR